MLISAGLAALAIVLAAAVYVLVSTRQPGRRPRKKAASRKPQGRMDIDAPIDMLGYPALHDVSLPDATGGTVRIDHLIRLPSSILVVGTMPPDLQGEITGHDAAQVWTIHDGAAATHCRNPVHDQKPLVAAFRRRFPLLRVKGLIVFPDAVSFPGGTPSGAVRLSELGPELEEMLKLEGVPSPTTELAWTQISRAAGAKTGQHDAAEEA